MNFACLFVSKHLYEIISFEQKTKQGTLTRFLKIILEIIKKTHKIALFLDSRKIEIIVFI